MFCQNCGTKLKDGEERCPKCGLRSGVTPPPASGGKAFASGLGRERIVHLFRAASMEPDGKFYAAGGIPGNVMSGVMTCLSGTGVGEGDILGVYLVDSKRYGMFGYALTEQALYNFGGFMQLKMGGGACTVIPFSRISKIAVSKRYGVGKNCWMDGPFWDMQIYVDGTVAAKLYYYRHFSDNHVNLFGRTKERFPIQLKEYVIAVNEMAKAAQGRPVIELRLDNPSDADRVPIPPQDRTVVASSAARLLLRFLSQGILVALLAQLFIFWFLWGHDWGKCLWPILTLIAALVLSVFARGTFASLLGRGGRFAGNLARILFIPLMAAVCALPAYLAWDRLGLADNFVKDEASAASASPDGMVLLPSGTFVRGLDRNAGVYNMFVTPSHQVTLTRSFAICDHELTQGEFKSVMGRLPPCVTGPRGKGDDYPVYGVSWYMAIAYCNKRSVAEGLKPCYSVQGVSDWAALSFKDVPAKADAAWNAVTCDFDADGWRLPTEAEWEYAARAGGGTTDSYSWSGCLSADSLRDYAWYGDRKCHRIRTKAANAYGLYDMSGNVWEWCWDRYGAKVYEDCAGGVTDPVGPESGEKRARRGGGWEVGFEVCTVYGRMSEKPDFAYHMFGSELKDPMGLRLVRTAD